MGRRMDDAGAVAALSSLGHFRHRQCSADEARGRAMVPALAVRALARRQQSLGPPGVLHRIQLKCVAKSGEPAFYDGIGSMSSEEDVSDALENPPKRS